MRALIQDALTTSYGDNSHTKVRKQDGENDPVSKNMCCVVWERCTALMPSWTTVLIFISQTPSGTLELSLCMVHTLRPEFEPPAPT